MIFNFFKHECTHSRVSAETKEAYCPDCGALVQNKWFLMRCKCCNIKRSAHTRYNEIVPDTKFCKNCGSDKYYIQELDSVNFTDIRYAVYKKIVVENKEQNTFTQQIWVEEEKTNQTFIKSIPLFS